MKGLSYDPHPLSGYYVGFIVTDLLTIRRPNVRFMFKVSLCVTRRVHPYTHLMLPRSFRGAFTALFCFVSNCVVSAQTAGATAHLSGRVLVDLPADTAEKSLQRLSEQSGREVLFPADAVENMRTQPVKGEMTPRVALDAMLAGTTLTGVEDARTGAITIRRGALFPPKTSAAPRVEPYSARTAAEPLNEVVELSPFEITESVDDKWSATSTLLGNRTGQELVKVPVTVDVLTRDFMNDIGVFNLEDAAAFVSGVTAVPRIEAKSDNDRLTFRGLTSGGSGNVFAPLSSRNFFPWMVPSDTYNVERFDFGKGSNSLLFGDSAPGGQATTTTKRARFITANEGLAFYDSFGSYRLQLDLNRKINRQLAIRLNVVNRSEKSYVEGNYQRFRAGDIAVTYRPFTNTVISFEAERGQFQRRRADNYAAIRDVAAPGRSFATNNRWVYTSDGEIIHRTSTSPAAIDRTGTGGNVMSLLAGQTVGVRMPDGSQKLFHGLDRTFNLRGIGDYLDRPYNVVTAMVEQNIGKLSLQASYNQQFQHQDRNDVAFGAGVTTAPVIDVDGAGRPYIDMPGNIATYKVFGNTLKAGRLSAAYPFAFGRVMKQYLVLTATRSRDYAVNRRFGLANTAEPGLAANNLLQFRAYLDDPRALSNGGWDRFLIGNLPRTATFQPTVFESYLNTGPFIDVRYTRNYTASASGEYFGGRLNSLVGISYNQLSRKNPVDAAYATDARGFVTFFKTPEEAPEMYRYDPKYTLTAKSWLAGLTYALFKRDAASVSLYGIYSQSFNFQSQLTFTGRDLGPSKGSTYEGGLKGDLFHGKVFYTIAAYEIERQHMGYAWTPDTVTPSQFEDLFNPNNLLPSSPAFFRVETGLGNERRTVDSQEKSSGIELTLIGKRFYGLQARLTFSKSKVEATRDFSDFKRMLDAAVARTAAANAPGGDRTQAENASYLANAQNILLSNTNITVVTGRRSAPYTGSLVLDYQFTRPAGLRLGLTGVWTPDYNVAILDAAVYRGGASCPLGLYAIYDCKIFRHRTSFRLGLNRVYDLAQGNSDYYKTGANSLNAATGRPNYIYRYTDPVSATLSATVKF